MQDTFKEQLVKRQIKHKDILIRIIILSLVFIIGYILAMVLPFLSFFIFGTYIFLTYLIISTLKIEYEYILTNDVLDIDIIYNKRKRKNVFTISLRDVEIMAHINSSGYKEMSYKKIKTKDFSSGTLNENIYVFFITYKGEKVKVIIEPNTSFVNTISRRLSPTKLYVKE